jgi:hypothetical protein
MHGLRNMHERIVRLLTDPLQGTASLRPRRLPHLLVTLVAVAVAAGTLSTKAGAEGLADDGGASWRLEQPSPPTVAPEETPTPVGLGKIGDIQFWAPNRGLLITAGDGSTIPAGVWAYDGRSWHELSSVCGGADGRIAWASPEEFWTISDGRPGQAPDALGNPPPLEDNTLCHFAGGKVVASYASPAFSANSYQPMHAAGCISPTDCWFAGNPLPGGQVGAFHLHWNGSSLVEEPYAPEGHAVEAMTPFEGQLYESVRLTKGDLISEASPGPPVLHSINRAGVQPTFEALPGPPLYAPEEFGEALDFLHLSASDNAVWGAAGPQPELPAGSRPAQVTVVRKSGGTWRQLLGPLTVPSGETLFPNDIVSSISAEPGTEGAWMALKTQEDAAQPSPTAPATVARMSSEGIVSDQQQLPSAGEGIEPKGAAVKSACPAPHDCWLATTQGWLFHLTTGKEELAQDGDPAFAGLITERPPDAGVPQASPGGPSPPVSGLQAESHGSVAAPEVKITEVKITPPPGSVRVPLLSNLRTRILHGNILELRFHLAVRARVRLLARRNRVLVASTPMRTLAAGNRRLLLRLDIHRWPTKLELKTRPLAPLPMVMAAAGR